MPQPVVPRLRRLSTAVLSLALAGVGALAAVTVAAPAGAAVGDEKIAWLEIENGVISGGPALNSGDHGNFSGTGSYTFRETGMTSTMTVTAPAAGSYPVWIRYAAGPLTPEENVTRAMGLLTNGGARQSVSYPLTGSWETWGWSSATVTLDQGANTLAVQCDRSVEMCRLNFDAVQVGGTAPDTCVATPVAPGATRLFDGTIASFDQWRKAGAGGFGHQTDCTIRGFRGQGITWTTAQQTGPYTLGVDWRRTDAQAASSVYVASSTNTSATPNGGYQVRIGATDTGAIAYAGTTQAADAAAVAAAVNPVGAWNHFDVQLTPKRIRVLLNGAPVNVVDRTAPTTGHIGLENRAVATGVNDQVSFRDVQVTPSVVLGELAGPARRATLADGTTVNQGGESTLAHLVADSQRWATRGAAGGTAKIALVSPTALQADLVPSSDEVTYAQAAAVVADEPLVNRRLTGAQLKTVLEQQWQRTAGDAVPTPAFRRLGASSGFTWTHDATRPEGDRITGMWLDGVAILPAGTYSVTASQSLADGGDNFRAFDVGVERFPDATTRSALAAYLADASATGVLGLPATQRAVGVHVPGSATSYQAGTTYAVDLSSWSYSTASDPVDTVVDVTIGGQSAGSFPVSTAGDAAFDERGTVAVRAVVPVSLPTAATTVVVVGRTTGTTVRLPINVTAAPTTPTPTPDPDPTPVPTPTPGPAPSAPAPTKATSTIAVKVKPGRIVARRTKATLVVTVDSAGATPTGTVMVKVGRKLVESALRRGRATLVLPKLPKPRMTRIKVTYTGDGATLSTARTLQIRAVAP